MLFDKLAELTREHECWTYIKPHTRARNGRAAYMAFTNHYLGPNNIGNMAATAEHKLINATYRGEGRHGDFEEYATLHKEQHTILEGLRSMDMQEWMKEAKQGTYLLGSRLQHLTVPKHRSYAMLSSGKILPNVWSYSRTTSCKPRLTSPKSSIQRKERPR